MIYMGLEVFRVCTSNPKDCGFAVFAEHGENRCIECWTGKKFNLLCDYTRKW